MTIFEKIHGLSRRRMGLLDRKIINDLLALEAKLQSIDENNTLSLEEKETAMGKALKEFELKLAMKGGETPGLIIR